jgi:hypothetical protein
MRKLPIQPNGLCRRCGGDHWTVTAVFSETALDIAESAVGLGLAVATGHGFVQHSTASNLSTYPGIPAAVVAKLNEIPAERLARVGEFMRTMERAKIKDRGAEECRACGTLFVRTKGPAWHVEGYCSRMCLVQAQGISAAAASGGTGRQKIDTISVRCGAGHSFEVAASFAGMLRPCPQCGMKTPVVEAPPDSQKTSAPSGATSGFVQAGEQLARKFLAAVQADRFRDKVFPFDADGDLPAAERLQAFRRFEQLVKSQKWAPKFTVIDVAEGTEDSVVVYFAGSQGNWLVLLGGYHYDTRQWKLDAYETAERSFARPEGESFENYVLQNIRDAKATGRPYRPGETKNGSYYIEY